MRFLPLSLLLAAVVLTPFRPAAAQAPAPLSLRATTVQLAATATLLPEASVAREQPAALSDDPYQHGTRKEGMALIIVGVAGIVTGLVIDEPVVSILAAGVGGLGLYLYLR